MSKIEPDPAPPTATPATILIVDDEASMRETIEGVLESEGYRLASAASGPEALARAAALVPDLVLLDVMMSGMDGLEVCRRLRADERLAQVPVIIVTSLGDHDSRMRGIEAGADDVLSKPFDVVELRARVRTVTRLNRFRRLLAERARFEWVVEQAEEGYLTVGDRDEVLYANPRARELLGLASSPVVGTFFELSRRHHRWQPRDAWEAWAEAPAKPPPAQLFLIRPESATEPAAWLQVEALDLPAGAGPSRVVRLRDVSGPMALRRDMWGFHALVSHKLRTPTQGLIGSLSVIAARPPGLTPDDLAGLAEAALASSQRLQGHIMDVLEYLEAGRLTRPGGLEAERLARAAGDVATALALRVPRVAVAPGLAGALIALAPRAMELVLSELLENAKKFHPRNDPSVEIALAPAGDDTASLRVSDDGRTLSLEQLARAWQPYYQPEKRFTGEVPGTGLGLAMVATLVWSVGGACRIANRTPGPGVEVELVLPLTRPPVD